MARDAGAKKVYLTSAAPPIRYPNIYGIDIPTRKELVAYERNEDGVSKELGCDWVVYQRLCDLEDSIREAGECPEQGENREYYWLLVFFNSMLF
jgi:amidophosphoribosyltransferase